MHSSNLITKPLSQPNCNCLSANWCGRSRQDFDLPEACSRQWNNKRQDFHIYIRVDMFVNARRCNIIKQQKCLSQQIRQQQRTTMSQLPLEAANLRSRHGMCGKCFFIWFTLRQPGDALRMLLPLHPRLLLRLLADVLGPLRCWNCGCSRGKCEIYEVLQFRYQQCKNINNNSKQLWYFNTNNNNDNLLMFKKKEKIWHHWPGFVGGRDLWQFGRQHRHVVASLLGEESPRRFDR